MRIKWNGHASFTITASDGTVIVTDPYEPGGFGGAITYDKIPDKADIVTVSHDHADHNYVEGVPGSPHVVRASDTAKGIEFSGITTYHDQSKGSERGQNTILVFTVDSVRICHLGDLGHSLEDETLRQIGQVDVLFLPIGGTFTIDPNEAARVMEALNPKVTIPMHYKTEKCGFPLAKIDDFLHGKEDITVRESGAQLEITSDSLPKDKQIRVLTHAC